MIAPSASNNYNVGVSPGITLSPKPTDYGYDAGAPGGVLSNTTSMSPLTGTVKLNIPPEPAGLLLPILLIGAVAVGYKILTKGKQYGTAMR